MNDLHAFEPSTDNVAIAYSEELERRPLVEILQRVDREVSNLGILAERVQEVLSPLIIEGCTSERLEQSQGLDLLTQSLFGLSAFLTTLSPELAPHWQVSPLYAAKAVTLSGLSHRLSGLSEEEDGIKLLDDVCSGECDLF